MKKKKDSFLSEMKRLIPNKTKSPPVKKISTEDKTFELEIPPRFRDDLGKYLKSFADFANETIDSVSEYLDKKYSVGFENQEVREVFLQKMREEFDKYLSSYSSEEKEFLIIDFIGEELEELFDTISLDNLEDLTKSIEQKKDSIFTAWLNHQIFKNHLPSWSEIFIPLWSVLEPILFTELTKETTIITTSKNTDHKIS